MAATATTLARIAALPVFVPLPLPRGMDTWTTPSFSDRLRAMPVAVPMPIFAPVVVPELKTCLTCHEEKDVREFAVDNNDDDQYDYCHACMEARAVLPCGCTVDCTLDHTRPQGVLDMSVLLYRNLLPLDAR